MDLTWDRIRVTILGEAPLDPDCEAFGRAPGIDGIAGEHERFTRESPRDLMLRIPIRTVARKQRDHDVRSKCAQHGDDILQQRIARPSGVHDGVILRSAEIVRSSEILVRSVAFAFGPIGNPVIVNAVLSCQRPGC